jgi:flagella basal body P-ring formation protein FlgA
VKRSFILIISITIGIILFKAESHGINAGTYSIHSIVQQYIEANMPWPPGTVRVDFLSEEAETTAQNRNVTNVTYRIEPAGNQDFIGDMVFLVKSYKNGSLVRTESVRTRIEVLRDIIISSRALPAGTILMDSDVRTIQKWVRRIHPQSLSSFETTTGKRLTIQLASGVEILSTMLKDTPLVRKGKMVRMVFDNGLMHIVTVGLSEEDGVAGNIVRVKNITSNKIIYARVLSDSLVGIDF